MLIANILLAAMTFQKFCKVITKAYHIKKKNIQLVKGILIESQIIEKNNFVKSYNEYLKKNIA